MNNEQEQVWRESFEKTFATPLERYKDKDREYKNIETHRMWMAYLQARKTASLEIRDLNIEKGQWRDCAENLEAKNKKLKELVEEAIDYVEDYQLSHPEWCNHNSIEPKCTCGEEDLLNRKLEWLEKANRLTADDKE